MIRQAARMDREDFDTRYLMARVLAGEIDSPKQ